VRAFQSHHKIPCRGDLLSANPSSGITVGFVVVPQGMAYALLAKLPAEYGLYTSFVGFLLYWAFATSKDITIGVSFPAACPKSPYSSSLINTEYLDRGCHVGIMFPSRLV
jgi:MFS superfamily sulfate permease-like transporter